MCPGETTATKVKALSSTVTFIDRRVACHQAYDLLILSIDNKKKIPFVKRLKNSSRCL